MQEEFGRSQVAVGRQHEIDGVIGGINRPIEVRPLGGDPDIGLPPDKIGPGAGAHEVSDSKWTHSAAPSQMVT